MQRDNDQSFEKIYYYLNVKHVESYKIRSRPNQRLTAWALNSYIYFSLLILYFEGDFNEFEKISTFSKEFSACNFISYFYFFQNPFINKHTTDIMPHQFCHI